jgi:hypothetical protein
MASAFFMSRHESFILKFSFHPEDDNWHGRLTHVASQETTYFAGLEDLVDAIASFVPIKPNVTLDMTQPLNYTDVSNKYRIGLDTSPVDFTWKEHIPDSINPEDEL